MAKTPKHGIHGLRKNVYGDRPLMDYIDRMQREHHARGFSAEVVELLEHGIIKRDGREAFDAIQERRSADLEASKQ